MEHVEVITRKNYICKIDKEDYDRLPCKYIDIIETGKNIYARVKIEGKRFRLHRWIMNCKKGDIVDHINGDGLDNRKDNLRLCTHSQNMANRSPAGKVPYLGVYIVYRTHGIKYRAAININKKKVCLGYYENAIDAAKAYDKAAIKIHGEFANLNFK